MVKEQRKRLKLSRVTCRDHHLEERLMAVIILSAIINRVTLSKFYLCLSMIAGCVR